MLCIGVTNTINIQFTVGVVIAVSMNQTSTDSILYYKVTNEINKAGVPYFFNEESENGFVCQLHITQGNYSVDS